MCERERKNISIKQYGTFPIEVKLILSWWSIFIYTNQNWNILMLCLSLIHSFTFLSMIDDIHLFNESFLEVYKCSSSFSRIKQSTLVKWAYPIRKYRNIFDCYHLVSNINLIWPRILFPGINVWKNSHEICLDIRRLITIHVNIAFKQR